MKTDLPRPTEAEVELLKILWTLGPSTVRDVHDEHTRRARQTAYTTTLKMLQVMHAKGLVIRDESQRAHRFAAAVSRDATERAFVGDLITRLFDGSRARLVLQALGNEGAPPAAERDEIRQLLAAMEKTSP